MPRGLQPGSGRDQSYLDPISSPTWTLKVRKNIRPITFKKSPTGFDLHALWVQVR